MSAWRSLSLFQPPTYDPGCVILAPARPRFVSLSCLPRLSSVCCVLSENTRSPPVSPAGPCACTEQVGLALELQPLSQHPGPCRGAALTIPTLQMQELRLRGG